MAKFLILYNGSAQASELMANSTPEEMRTSMDEWIKWKDDASKTIKVDFGMPLEAVSRVSPDGVTDCDNQASGYSIVEGESKEAVIELLKSHPHLKRSDASIDVLEMLSMPGM